MTAQISCPDCGSYNVRRVSPVDSEGLAEFRCAECTTYFVEQTVDAAQSRLDQEQTRCTTI